MNDGFVKELAERLERPQVVAVAGRDRLVLPPTWQDKTPDRPSPRALAVHSLRALVDYVEANVDKLPLGDVMGHVFDPSTVRLIGPLDADQARFCYLEAAAPVRPFPFGTFMDQETFAIKLQTGFVPSPARDDLLRIVSSIAENNVRESTDDGVTQEVVARAGVVMKERQKLPMIVQLAPFRTFPEVEQPISPFLLRAKAGADAPVLALFEADGGKWSIDALEAIAAWLEEKVGSKINVIG